VRLGLKRTRTTLGTDYLTCHSSTATLTEDREGFAGVAGLEDQTLIVLVNCGKTKSCCVINKNDLRRRLSGSSVSARQ